MIDGAISDERYAFQEKPGRQDHDDPEGGLGFRAQKGGCVKYSELELVLENESVA